MTRSKTIKPLASVMVIVMIISFTLVSLGTGNVSASEDVQSGNETDSMLLSGNNIRTPAEWERVDTVLIARHDDYEDYYDSLQDSIQDAGANYHNFHRGTGVNEASMYIRDYGPITIMNNGVREYNDLIGLNDPFEGYYPVQDIVDEFDSGATVNDAGLGTDGGDFMIDSGGILYSGRDVSDSLNLDAYGIHTARGLENLGETPHVHIDMYAKLIDENTVILPEIPADGGGLTQDEITFINELYDYFDNAVARNREGYDITEIEIWRDGHILYNYANSLIVNNLILIPKFGTPYNDNDTTAYNKYEDAIGKSRYDYSIITVDVSDLIGASRDGFVHCTTMQIAKENAAPVISDVEVDLDTSPGEAIITAKFENVQGEDSETSRTLFYRKYGSNTLETEEFDYISSPNIYKAVIDLDTEYPYEYFIRAEDSYKAVGYYGDTWTPYFLNTPTPHVEITYPSDGQTVPGKDVTVTWGSELLTDYIDHYMIARSFGFIWSGTTVGKNTSHTYELDPGEYTIRVYVYTVFEESTYDEVTFTVSDQIHSDGDDAIWIPENTVTILWDLDGRYDNEAVYFEVNLNRGDWLNIGTDTRHTFDELEDGKNTVTVRMKDVNGTIWQESLVLLVGKG